MSQLPVIPPKLRGWFHLGATPAVIIASLVLFILSKESLKFAVAIYSITAIMLFSVSAIYHRVPWVPAKKKIWRRWDHANINLLIAGSYTPFAVALGQRWVLVCESFGSTHHVGCTLLTI
jgi:hemolysin III